MLAFYGTRISGRMSETPERFLVCHAVPVSRTGPQTYRGSELGLPTDDMVTVWRSAKEVFAPAAMSSLEGKPVTSPHPPTFIDSANASAYTRGHAQNVRKGNRLPDGNWPLVADLVITDATLISQIKNGLRETSVGYTYDLVPRDDGTFDQVSIKANHVAVVPSGRAGGNVRIMDAMGPSEDFAALARRYLNRNPAEVVPGSEVRRLQDSREAMSKKHNNEEEDRIEPEESQDEKLDRLIAVLEECVAKLEERETSARDRKQGDWADDSALAHLHRVRPFIEASGDRKAIDQYNAAVKAVKRQTANLVSALDAMPRRAVTSNDRRTEAMEWEQAARRYHRRDFHIRSDREEQREDFRRKPVGVAWDADEPETFEQLCSRRRREMLSERKGR